MCCSQWVSYETGVSLLSADHVANKLTQKFRENLCNSVAKNIMLSKIESLVEFAYENVPLYRRLYQKKPRIKSLADFKQLPYLTINDFVLCSIEDVLSNMGEAVSILPPLENKTIFPFPRLENAADRDSRYRVFYFLLDQAQALESPRTRGSASFLIITDTSHSYYCGEIANNLLFYKHPTWMMLLRDHSADEVRTWIDRFEPDCLLLGLDRIPDGVENWGVSRIFTVNQYDRDLSMDIRHFDIYAVTEAGWIGIRLPGSHYIYPEEYFFMEVNPADNIITLTVLGNCPLQPFIRYKTSDRGQIMGKNLFRVTYTGEH